MSEPIQETDVNDLITPVRAYAQTAHELFMEFKHAGFNKDEALTLLISTLPDWVFPIPYDDDDDYEDEDEIPEMEADEGDDD